MVRPMFRVVLSCVFVVSSFALAQERSPMTLRELLDEAIEKNPEIHAAQQRWFAARKRAPQVSALDDPMVTYTRWLSTPETRVGPQENVFMISQKIPFPGKLGLKENIADQDAEEVQARFDATKRDVLFSVKQTYFDLYWIDRSLEILREYRDLLLDFKRVAEEEYATGQGIQANVLKAQVEISTILERELLFRRMQKSHIAKMNVLLNRSQNSHLAIALAIDRFRIVVSESTLVKKGLKDRQELYGSSAMIRKTEFMSDLARKEYLPNFNLQASYITIPTLPSAFSDAGKDPYSISIGINLPIQLGRRAAAVEEADALTLANKDSYRNTENVVRSEIADLLFQVNTVGETLDLYEQGLMLQAESSLESALSAYRTGRLDFLSLLDSERMLLQVRLSYAREQATYQKTVAALARSVGGELPE